MLPKAFVSTSRHFCKCMIAVMHLAMTGVPVIDPDLIFVDSASSIMTKHVTQSLDEILRGPQNYH